MARFLRRLRRDVITDILSQAGRNFSNIGVLIRDMFGHKRSGSGAAGGGNADFHQGGEAPWERSTFFSPTKRLPSTKAIRTAPSPRLAVTPRAAHAMILGVAATPASPQRPRFLPDLGNKIKRALAKPIRKLLRRKDTEVLRRQREEMAAKQRLFRGEGMEEDVGKSGEEADGKEEEEEEENRGMEEGGVDEEEGEEGDGVLGAGPGAGASSSDGNVGFASDSFTDDDVMGWREAKAQRQRRPLGSSGGGVSYSGGNERGRREGE